MRFDLKLIQGSEAYECCLFKNFTNFDFFVSCENLVPLNRHETVPI